MAAQTQVAPGGIAIECTVSHRLKLYSLTHTADIMKRYFTTEVLSSEDLEKKKKCVNCHKGKLLFLPTRLSPITCTLNPFTR
jgi:hypothetical protein